MTVGIHIRSLLRGFRTILIASVAVAIYVWIETVRIASSGQTKLVLRPQPPLEIPQPLLLP